MKNNVAFDIDNTLYKIVYDFTGGIARPKLQIPNYELLQVLFWYYKNGDNIFVWSAGGIDYAKSICEKLGINDLVSVIRKDKQSCIEHNITLTYDDQEIDLGKVNILVKNMETK